MRTNELMATNNWLIIPGLTLMPEDYSSLSRGLVGTVIVADAWKENFISLPSELIPFIRSKFGDRPYRIIGHSVGGLTSIELLELDRELVSEVILLDPAIPAFDRTGEKVKVRSYLGYFIGKLFEPLVFLFPSLPLALRRILFKVVSKGTGQVSDEVLKARYKGLENYRSLLKDFRDSEIQAIRVSNLLKSFSGQEHSNRILQINAVSKTGKSKDDRGQQKLATLIGSTVVKLKNVHHLFPITRPEETLEMIFSWLESRK